MSSENMPPNQQKYSDEILPLTALRFTAALYVFLFHIHIRWPLASSSSIPGKILAHGAIGMSLFFILSGFVLGYRFNRGIKDYNEYAYGRFTRIYPTYVIAALVTLPWLISSLPQGIASTQVQIGRYLFIIFANIFLIQAWIPQLFAYWNNGGSWSISVEAFFYILFPFLMNRLMKMRNEKLYLLLIFLYTLASIPGISFFLFANQPGFVIFYAIPIFRLSEFILGVIGGLIFARGVRISMPGVAVVICIATFYLYLGYGPDFGFVFVADNWIVVPIWSLLIFSCASLRKGYIYNVMSNKILNHLGQISYSFYSFQALIVLTMIDHHDSLTIKFPLLKNNYILCFITFLILILCSFISFTLLEKKFRVYLNNKWQKKNISPSVDSLQSGLFDLAKQINKNVAAI